MEMTVALMRLDNDNLLVFAISRAEVVIDRVLKVVFELKSPKMA